MPSEARAKPLPTKNDKTRTNDPMKKDAIIDLLENDLKEMHTLVETFREPDRIASAFLELLQQKQESLAKEIKLLDYWATENLTEPSGAELTGRAGLHHQKQETTPEAKPVTPPVTEAPKPSVIKPSNPSAGVEDYFASELEDTPELSDLLADIAQRPDEAAHKAPKPKESGQVPDAEVATAAPNATPAKNDEKEGEAQSLAQKAADIANYGAPVNDINKAMGINDRFLYQRELFKGNKMAFDAALETVNMAASYSQAYSYLRQTFGWDETDPTAEAFLKAVHRRFL